ncbi:MAG: prolipoprotein diacylglyceryl transferase [Bacteroidia bacterium]|nr:prolipoprotein diacylglyceryl transferase [Bacteroidia bacterium]
MIAAIFWNVDPEIVSLGPVHLRWYGLLFALGFLIGHGIMLRIMRQEGKPDSNLDTLTLHMLIGTIVGARLGHCLFYEPEVYLLDPIRILYVWEGGLASHGAAIGILTSLFLYSKKFPDQSFVWIADRIVITVALAGCFIRLGNLMNSEIIGKPTDMPWAFIFARIDELPRHPAQLYEAITCLILFGILYKLYWKHTNNLPAGLSFGIFLVWIFGLRILWETIKENQVSFEDNLPMNMGQILSIPLIIIGFWLIYRSQKNKLPQKS